MEQLRKELRAVYDALTMIRVSGDDVELMSAAKAGLRACWKLADMEPGEEET